MNIRPSRTESDYKAALRELSAYFDNEPEPGTDQLRIPATLVNRVAGGPERQSVRFGHPSGTLRVGAEATQVNGQRVVRKAIMSRSARGVDGGVGEGARLPLIQSPGRILAPLGAY